MSAVLPPEPRYQPAIPQNIVKSGALSDAQLETITYAGQAFEKMLNDGETRRGFFIGDGTGVGKGRQLSGVILDALNHGHGKGKAVWISKNQRLLMDAKRDWAGIGQDPEQIRPQNKTKAGTKLTAPDGVLFTTYDTIKQGATYDIHGKPTKAGEKSRLTQLVDWLGEDFDGVIVFDEAHAMGNALSVKGERGKTTPSQNALAGIALQRALPKARVLYVSATGAVEVMNLAYAERLGLWGTGTPFTSKAEFVARIDSGGIAAMEVVARDMKQLGLYMARQLSMHEVTYDRLEHTLTGEQRQIYDTLAQAWQTVLSHMNEALELTSANQNRNARAAALAQFWGAQQRFFNSVLTSMQMPSLIKAIEQDVKDGNAVVLQLVNTHEAALNDAVAKRNKETGEEVDEDALNLDITPRESLMRMVEKAFPTAEYQRVIDEDGNERWEQVLDSQGNPVENAEAVRRRDFLLEKLASLRVPHGPLDLLLQHFGEKRIAEVTGRSRRILFEDGREKIKRRAAGSANRAEVSAFQSGQKDILVFSMAGGTGASYHADLGAKNQKKRQHYLVQAGWRADEAIQGFGRTHRTNQAQAPHYRLVTTDLPAQRRFISSIARRLSQLGAITRGQRQASEGVFTEADNLESRYARDALEGLVTDVARGRVPGITQETFEKELGLEKAFDKQGRANKSGVPTITQFLNRLLSTTTERQTIIFNAFYERMESAVRGAAARGELDTGLQNLQALSVTRADEKTIYAHPETGSETRYIRVNTKIPVNLIPYSRLAKDKSIKGFAVNAQSGAIWAVSEERSRTNPKTGAIEQIRDLVRPNNNRRTVQSYEVNDRRRWRFLEKGNEAERLWTEQHDQMETTRDVERHFISGTVLPVWDRLEATRGRVFRVQLDSGERFIGLEVTQQELPTVLERFGVGAPKPDLSPETAADSVLKRSATLTLSNGWIVTRRRVSGENRIEVRGPNFTHERELEQAGVFKERIDYNQRYFIPTNRAGEVLGKLLRGREIVKVAQPDDPDFVQVRRLRPKAAGQQKELVRRARAIVRQINPDPTLGLRFAEQLFATGRSIEHHGYDPSSRVETAGTYAAKRNLITLSLSLSRGEMDNVAAHEAWHSVEALLTPDERAVLLRAYPTMAGVVHVERAANAFGDWYAARTRGVEFSLSAEVRRIFVRIRRFLERLGNMLRGLGFRSAEDIWELAASGELGARYLEQSRRQAVVDADFGTVAPIQPRPDYDFELAALRKPATALDPELQRAREAANRHLGIKPSIAQRVRASVDVYTDHFRDRAVQKVFDRFNSLKLAEREVSGTGQRLDATESAFTQAHLSQNLGLIMQMALEENAPKWDAAKGMLVRDPTKPGLFKILSRLKSEEELRDWEFYAWAKRADRLKKEGREPAEQDDIDLGLALGERNPHFEEIFQEWQTFNQSILDVAHAAGLLTDELRGKLAAYLDYVPFYRVETDPSGGLVHGRAMRLRKALEGQRSGIRHLKGSSRPVDIVENMVMNTARLLNASMRNIAMQRSVRVMTQLNVARGEPVIKKLPRSWRPTFIPMGFLQKQMAGLGADVNVEDDTKRQIAMLFGMTAPQGPDVVSVSVKGKPVYYRIYDDLLLESVSALSPRQLAGIVHVMGGFASLLRHGIVLDPGFAIRNFLRDSLSAWVTTGASMKHFGHILQSYGQAFQQSDQLKDIMAAGGGVGGWYDYTPSSVRTQLERSIGRHFGHEIMGAATGGFRVYAHLLRASEQANRLALYQQMQERGYSQAEAAFQAMDLLNFSARGSSEIVRIATHIIPFLNARLQGLHRLARGAAGETPNIGSWQSTRVGFFVNGAILTALTFGLWWMNKDDEEYQALPDWAKDIYYNIRMPASIESETGISWFRIPSPFEVGLIFSKVPERVWSTMWSEDDTARQLLSRLWWATHETFAINPPAAVAPVLEWWANEDFFLKIPIIPLGDQFRIPSGQGGPSTSSLMKRIGQTAGELFDTISVDQPELISPRVLEHLWTGYTGTLGRYALAGADWLTDTLAGDTAPRPQQRVDQWPVVRSFVSQNPPRSTRWKDEFYDLKGRIDATAGTLNEYRRQQEVERFRELAERRRDLLALKPVIDRIDKIARRLRKARSAIYDHPTMPPAEKRRRLDEILEREAALFENMRPVLRRLRNAPARHKEPQQQQETTTTREAA